MKELPLISSPLKLLTSRLCISTLLDPELESKGICTRIPFSVNCNSVFIIDLTSLGSPKDINCDDMGSWTWKGSYRCWCSVEDGDVQMLGKTLESNTSESDPCYQIWKRYYEHKCSIDVKKLIVFLEGEHFFCVLVPCFIKLETF